MYYYALHNTRYSNMSSIQNTISSIMTGIHTTSYKSFYIKTPLNLVFFHIKYQPLFDRLNVRQYIAFSLYSSLDYHLQRVHAIFLHLYFQLLGHHQGHCP